MAYNIDLSIQEVGKLVKTAANSDPDMFGDPEVKAVIYKCKALIDYQESTGDYAYNVRVR